MKKLLILLSIFIALSLGAENVAYIPYISNTTGIPDYWPATVPRSLGENFGPLQPGEIVTNRVWLNAFIASNTPVMAARKASMNLPNAARAQKIADTISDFQLAINNWANLNAAQQKAVLLRCVQVLKIMLEEHRVDVDIR